MNKAQEDAFIAQMRHEGISFGADWYDRTRRMVEAVLAVKPEIKFEWITDHHEGEADVDACFVNGIFVGSFRHATELSKAYAKGLTERDHFNTNDEARLFIESAFSSWYHSIGRAEQ